MPYIDQDKLAEIFTELDNEKNANNDLREALRRSKMESHGKYGVNISWIFLFIAIGVSIFLLINSSNKTSKLEENNQRLQREISVLEKGVRGIQNNLDTLTVYSVQIGAFKEKGMPLFSENLINFRVYPTQDFNAYSLGNFYTQEEAEEFLTFLKDLGFNDSWVLAFKNGERILLDE